MNIRPRCLLLQTLVAGAGLFLTAGLTRADFVINTGTAVNFSDQPGQNSNDGGNLSIENGGNSPTTVTFVFPGLVGGNLSINGTSVVNFPNALANYSTYYLNLGGIVNGDVNAYDSSTVNLAGGSIGGNIYANDSSTVNVSQNAYVGANLNGAGSSTTNMSGGMVSGDIYLQDNSVLNLSGGTIAGGDIFTQDNSTINVFGSITATGGNGDFTLLGTLADGTDLGPSGIEIFTPGGDPINVYPTPAPSGFILLLIGACSVLGWRAASRRAGSAIRPRCLAPILS